MKMRKLLLILAAGACALAVAPAYAQDVGDDEGDELEGVEMDVMESSETPNAASTKVLTLPESASDKAREHAQPGLDRANAARTDGRALGASTSEAAREGRGQSEDHRQNPPEQPPREHPGH